MSYGLWVNTIISTSFLVDSSTTNMYINWIIYAKSVIQKRANDELSIISTIFFSELNTTIKNITKGRITRIIIIRSQFFFKEDSRKTPSESKLYKTIAEVELKNELIFETTKLWSPFFSICRYLKRLKCILLLTYKRFLFI